ncbi:MULTISPECIES: flagellar type III secretion system pore protein FliP [Halomonas]|uniref:Flagellar biosynthetic protein FliP n=2 Tax=Halomonas TaxID=2745 RepID=A0ABQ0U7B0_9GAMM|nr:MULTISPECIES: flagellar type III secretion system pore protein FliP [Halomonas]PSJ22762.1 flagellar biosynthetic protein FliP [Halomonas sp. ND22Bw]KGE78525.1 flagellar biosynthesis protein flip [Halomonas salina]MDR5889237.1 flagellar type III secretion system pore protein FliP [Halomonas salina]WJY07209.1 flagellar type III secretion system pore protein FliP [Halomonas halophila]GEK74409.1 flagellar biosynthetic protein FliP [Halomonas halophila]
MNRFATRHARWWLLALLLVPGLALAQQIPGLISQPMEDGGQRWSLSLQTLLLLSSLAFLPAAVLMMTSFTRIIIVLGLLRTAMGTQATPPNQILLGLALFLTFFIMAPVFGEVYDQAWVPLSNGSIAFPEFLTQAQGPFREFMMAQTREPDLALFARLADVGQMQGPEDVPLRVLVPSFVTSELKTAFQIGFTIFIPFLIIDLVVASTLMGLGMMMVPPVTISLPFKLMLFVLVDGWQLIIGSLAESFYV